MGLECLLLTRDSALLSAIRAKFNELGIEILVRKDAALAVELSKRRHVDGCVIDCDDVLGGKEALSDIPSSRDQFLSREPSEKPRGQDSGGTARDCSADRTSIVSQ